MGGGTILLNRQLYHFAILLREFHHSNVVFSLYSPGEDPQGWLERYHRRLISETVNSMMALRFGAATRKNHSIRGRGLGRGSKFVRHNIRRVECV